MAASSLCNFLSNFLFPSALSRTKTPPAQVVPTPLSYDYLPTLSSSSITSPRSRDVLLAPVTEDDGASSSSSKDLLSVVFPSLAYANTLFFKSAYNVQVIVGEDEPEEVLLRRFRREVMRAGVIQECKRRKFFENKQEEKKRRTREAAKRNKRRFRRPFRAPLTDKQETPKSTSEDEEDNWELPEGGLPY